MCSLGFASITFVCTLGCALIGTALRTAISPAHLSKKSQDVIRLGMRLVATMTALPLGLVTAAAKGAFDSQDLAVKTPRQASSHSILWQSMTLPVSVSARRETLR
jgi:hypothetical protein